MFSMMYYMMIDTKEIINNLNVISRCIEYDFKDDKEKLKSIKGEVNVLKVFSDVYTPQTISESLLSLRKKLIFRFKKYSEPLSKSNKRLYLKIEKIIEKMPQKSGRIYHKAVEIRKTFDNDAEFLKQERESKELQLITQYVDMIISEYKVNIRKAPLSKKNVLEKMLGKHLTKYEAFLDKMIIPLLKEMEKNVDIYQEMQKNTIPNIFDDYQINPFFMYLVYSNLTSESKNKIKDSKSYDIFWQRFNKSLKLFNEVELYKNEKVDIPECFYSKKITFKVLKDVVCFIKENENLGNALHIVASSNNFSKSLLRKWIEANSAFYKKFQGKTCGSIFKKDFIEIDDVKQWFENLSLLDSRFGE